MRLFAAVWPPADVVMWLHSQSLPSVPGLRPTTPTQWHVTLAFYGEVPEEDLGALTDALGAAARSVPHPLQVRVGDRTIRLGRNALAVPVVGLEPLAVAVMTATERWLHEQRVFRGHLTLARARAHNGIPRSLAGVELDGIRSHDGAQSDDAHSHGVASSWTAHETCLVLSSPGPSGHQYRTIATAAVGPG
jgi:2'-5' RNA ligase